MATPGLSKSRFQLGLQCHKQLWLKAHRPRLADPISDQLQAIFDSGTAIGELARERFAPGVLIEDDFRHSAEALASTRAVMADPPHAIFEAAFEHGGVFVRPDVVQRSGDAWDLYEVKSSTSLKDENITDVAIQLWVLEGAGLPIRRAYLVHIDNQYVYEGGDYDLQRLFVAEDVTDAVRALQPQLSGLVADMQEMLRGPQPDIRIGGQCTRPYVCGFYGHCHACLPACPVTDLPRISAGMLEALLADEVLAITDIPLDYPGLSDRQRSTVEVMRSGAPVYSPALAGALEALRYPAHFLDFETTAFGLPQFAGTRPWQTLPFQWSDHVMYADGTLEHREFLYDGTSDPRRPFVESLLDALGDTGSIVVYSAYENTQLRMLAEAFPEHAAVIAAVQSRLFDLEVVVRTYVQHPGCGGRTSIKVVLPALVDDLSYDDLGIKEGGTASLVYQGVLAGTITGAQREQVLADLLSYCATDTMAMVRIFQVLQVAAI